MDNFLLVHKSILPKYYELVIKAREELESEGKSVSEVCKKFNISRSTFYKYKDYVYYPNEDNSKKAILSFKVNDIQGVLGNLINVISEAKCNVLTISQNMPIHNLAFITIMFDYGHISCQFDELIIKLKRIDGIKSCEVLAYE